MGTNPAVAELEIDATVACDRRVQNADGRLRVAIVSFGSRSPVPVGERSGTCQIVDGRQHLSRRAEQVLTAIVQSGRRKILLSRLHGLVKVELNELIAVPCLRRQELSPVLFRVACRDQERPAAAPGEEATQSQRERAERQAVSYITPEAWHAARRQGPHRLRYSAIPIDDPSDGTMAAE